MPFSAVGLELWSMTDQIYFDNFIVTDDEATASEFAKATWLVKKKLEMTSTSSSDSVIDGLLKAANDKPWLWAIYLLVILLPIVLVVLFCFGSKSGSKPTASAAADSVGQAKKTDAPTEDVVEEEGVVDEEEEEEVEGGGEGKEDLEELADEPEEVEIKVRVKVE